LRQTRCRSQDPPSWPQQVHHPKGLADNVPPVPLRLGPFPRRGRARLPPPYVQNTRWIAILWHCGKSSRGSSIKARDGEGTPLCIEVFSGNTSDTKTFGQQVTKVVERFGAQAVTFVGDRGMIKGPQIEQLQQYSDQEFHYITAITKPQIEKLLQEDAIQISLFDQELGEVQLLSLDRLSFFPGAH
jgi:hypothetical protein